MTQRDDTQQPKKFAEILRPIAKHLELERVGGGVPPHLCKDLAAPLDSQHSLKIATAADSSNLDSGGFFQASDNQAVSMSVGLPEVLRKRAMRLAGQPLKNEVFEYLRQHCIRQRLQEFSRLSSREQAMAKVGGLLHVYRANFEPRIYHFSQNNMLIAVFDRQHNRFYLRKNPPHIDHSDMSYVARPNVAGGTSVEFDVMPVQDVIWMYAQFDPEALLDVPPNIGVSWLQLRRFPTISPNLMTDDQLQIIRKLLTRLHRFEHLSANTPKQFLPTLMSDLTCLYLTRALTTPEEFLKHKKNNAVRLRVVSR